MELDIQMKKQCSKCGNQKEIDLFYKDRQKVDGLSPQCKSCIDKRMSNYRKNHKEQTHINYVRHYDCYKDRVLARSRKYYLKHKLKIHKQQIERMKKDRQTEEGRKRYNAHQTIARYLRLGKLKKKLCEVCNNSQSQSHHPNGYDNPLDIKWLCDIHHKEVHREIRRNN